MKHGSIHRAPRWRRALGGAAAALCLLAAAEAQAQFIYPPPRYVIIDESGVAQPYLAGHQVSNAVAFEGVHIWTTGTTGPLTCRYDAVSGKWGGWKAVYPYTAPHQPSSKPLLWSAEIPAAAAQSGEYGAIQAFHRYVDDNDGFPGESDDDDAWVGLPSLVGSPPSSMWWEDDGPVEVEELQDIVPMSALPQSPTAPVRVYGHSRARYNIVRLEANGAGWRRRDLGIHTSGGFTLYRHTLGPQSAVVLNGYDLVFAKKNDSDAVDGNRVVFHNGSSWQDLGAPYPDADFAGEPLAFVETFGEPRVTVLIVSTPDSGARDFQVWSRHWTGGGRPTATNGWSAWASHGRHPELGASEKFILRAAVAWQDNYARKRLNIFGNTQPAPGTEVELVELWSYQRDQTTALRHGGALVRLGLSHGGTRQEIATVSSASFVRPSGTITAWSPMRLSVFVRAKSGRIYERYWNQYSYDWAWLDLTPPPIGSILGTSGPPFTIKGF